MWPQEITQVRGICYCDPCQDYVICSEPSSPIVSDSSGSSGTTTTELSIKLIDGDPPNLQLTNWYHTKTSCIKLPLKSGGSLPIATHRFGGQGYTTSFGEAVVGPDGWMPTGRGGILSFLPFLAKQSESFPVPGIIIPYRRFAHYGTLDFTKQGSTIGDISYYVPNSAVPVTGRYDRSTYFFTEYDAGAGMYFRYGGESHTLQGRPLERFDRNGNKLTYHYSARQGSPPATLRNILRKITGDVSGVTPYFEYNGATNEQARPAPITKVFLRDDANASASRTIYYEYENNTAFASTFLRKVTHPNGCVIQYKFVDSLAGTSGTTAIRKEVDQEGYTTYFDYELNDASPFAQAYYRTRKSLEPEGRATYFHYTDMANTFTNVAGRPLTYFRYAQSSLGTVTDVQRKRNALGFTTYYEYNSRDRINRQIDPNGSVTYYEYDAASDALTNTISQSNGAASQYVYNANGHDPRKMIGPRNAGGFPVVTYYDYDVNRNRRNLTDALGNLTYWAYDSAGRARKQRDARLNTTYYNFDSTTGSMVSRVDAADNAAYFKYNSFRDMTRMVSPRWEETGSYAAFTTYHEYDSLDRKTKTIDAQNDVTYFYYTSRGDLSASIDARGTETDYHYNGLRLLTDRKVIDIAGVKLAQTYYAYNAYKNRTKEQDGRGFTTYYVYDVLDRVRVTNDALNNKTYFAYDSVGNRSKVQDARLNTAYFNYTSLSQMRSSRDAAGNEAYFFYDLAGNRTKARDARLNTAYFFYDALDRQNAARDAQGKYTYFFYDAVGNRSHMRDANLNTTYYFFDELNRQRTTRDALANFTYFYYDAAGNTTRVRNARQNTAYFFYDTLDRQKAVRDALGNKTYFGYDAVGNRRKVQDARQNTAYFAFDGLNRNRAACDALNNQTYFFFDANSNTTRVRDARLNTAYYFYDALNRQSALRDALANAAYYAYDAVGNRRKAVSPRTFAAYFNYDSINRLRNTQDAVGGNVYFGYDAVSNTTRVRDALVRTTYFVYDSLNRATAVTDALNNSVYFGYDAVGNRRLERDALGQRTYFNYDALNRLSYIADPLGRNAYYAYDANSNLRKTRDNNGLNTYFVYDALDRRTQIRYSGEGYGVQAYGTSAYGAPVQYFAYDGMSNLSKVLDAWGASYFVYDALNRVSKRTTPRGDALYYAYDGVSNLTKLRYPQGTAACYYVYDAANRMTTLDSPVGKRAYFVYDADSNVAKKRLGNGMSVYFAYDNADRVAAIRYLKSTGGGMTYFAYNRDVSGRINKIARETDLAVYYAYDSVDRVTAETWRKKSDYSQIYAFSYVYDAAGNRTRMRREAAAGVETESVYYTYNGDNSTRKRRKQIPPATFETAYYVYNLNGSRTREIIGANTTYYEYGPHGFMTAILPPAATATRFYYDGQLNRYKVDLAGTPTYFLWNGLNEIEERNADGTLAARQTHGYAMIPGIGSAEEVQRTTSTTTYYQYPLMDHRGTVYAVADAGQNKQIEYVQDAFGRQLATPGGSNPTVPNDLQYQTNWRTLTVGGKRLCVSPSRIYVPDDGIFLERDPLPNLMKLQSQFIGNTLGIFSATNLSRTIILEVQKCLAPTSNYWKWYMNGYRAWSSCPPSQVDRDGFGEAAPPDKTPPTKPPDPNAPWTFDPQKTPQGNYDQMLGVKIEFDVTKCGCECTDFGFIQTTDTSGKRFPWRDGDEDPPGSGKPPPKGGPTIDRNWDNPQFRKDPSPFFGGKRGSKMTDPVNQDGTYETCVICMDKGKEGTVLGCYSWRVSNNGKTVSPIGGSTSPSASYKQAATEWNDYAKKKGWPAISTLKDCSGKDY